MKAEEATARFLKRVYIAGPMTGLPGWNHKAFHDAEEMISGWGWQVVNPAMHYHDSPPGSLPRHRYLAADVVALVTRCEAIALLPGWEKSEGAKLEAQIAFDLGYDCYLVRLGGIRGGLQYQQRSFIKEMLDRDLHP